MPSFNPEVLEHDVRTALMMTAATQSDSFISRIAKIVPSSASLERYPYMGATPAFQDLALHGEVPYAMIPSKPYTLVNKEFVVGLEFFLSDLEDDQTGMIQARVNEITPKYYQHRVKTAIDALVNGTSSTLGIGYDGAPFFSASHLALGAEGTQDNTVTNSGQTTAAIQTDLNSAITKMMTLKDEAGQPLGGVMDLLILAPPSLSRVLNEALFAQMLSNTSNVGFRGFNISVELSPYLTGNSWYLLNVGQGLKPLIFQDRRGLDVAYEEDKTVKRVARWAGSARYVAGYGPWQLAVKVV